MIKRYFSHYIYIHPDIYLKNHIVEVSDEKIIRVFPFEKEIEKTEFYNGILLFLPKDMNIDQTSIEKIKSNIYPSNNIASIKDIKYKIYYEDNCL